MRFASGPLTNRLFSRIVYEHVKRGEGIGALSTVLSGLVFPILTVLAVQLFRAQHYVVLLMVALLAFTRLAPFAMAAALAYFLLTKYWIGVGLLTLYFAVAGLALYCGSLNVTRLLRAGAPMISPFEGMGDLLAVLVLEPVLLGLALLTHGWAFVLCVMCLALVVLFHAARCLSRLHPKWNQLHQPLMFRYAAFAGKEHALATREAREFDVMLPLRDLVSSVFPSRDHHVIQQSLIHASDRLKAFADRDLLAEMICRTNPTVESDRAREVLDRAAARGLSGEDRHFLLIRYVIAEIVEEVLGREERGRYLLGVFQGVAN